MAFRWLTLSQASNLKDMVEDHYAGKLQVSLAGLDQLDRPVLHITHRNGEHLWALRHDGFDISEPADAAMPVRDFTDEETENMPTQDAELLFSLPIHPHTHKEGL